MRVANLCQLIILQRPPNGWAAASSQERALFQIQKTPSPARRSTTRQLAMGFMMISLCGYGLRADAIACLFRAPKMGARIYEPINPL